jgi:hypothetical protein
MCIAGSETTQRQQAQNDREVNPLDTAPAPQTRHATRLLVSAGAQVPIAQRGHAAIIIDSSGHGRWLKREKKRLLEQIV